MTDSPLSAGKGEDMRKLVTTSLSAAALIFSGLMVGSAIGQDKKADKGATKAVIKVVAENPKVIATETTYAPGAESNTSRAEVRVVRALSGGTLQRTYADGKKETVHWKAGDVKYAPKATFVNKNVGKTEVVLFVTTLK